MTLWKNENGNITEIHCTYDPATKSGTGCQKKVKGILHWVEASTAVDMEVRLYDYLLSTEDDETADKDFLQQLNPNSLEVKSAKGEAVFRSTQAGDHYHFLRTGYFVTDKDSTADHIVMNRTVGMRDTWAKMQKKQG